ncbi:hypothetical protein F4809DRAFT_554470 [Biscogniauxia mediterranea]|nr:hypothetical protein F4809DRAFT_554470 [Biscogniauxia mediterranea]
MPASASSPFSGPNPFASDPGMPSFGLNNEFDFYDPDDSQNPEGTSLFDLAAGDHLDAAAFADPKTLPFGPGQAGDISSTDSVTGYPPPSHRGSSSSSSSSQRSTDSTSPKTSRTSMDMMMVDEPFAVTWKVENGGTNNDSNFMMFDAIDPTTADMSNVFDFESASSSPSPPTANSKPPEAAVMSDNHFKGPAAKRIKSHRKGQSQHSLSQSMNRLKTNNSRDVSPTSNLAANHESPSAAMFMSSPSPDNQLTYFSGMGTIGLNLTPSWPSMSSLQANGSLSQMRPDSGIPPQAHGLPAYNPQAVLSKVPPRPRLVVQPTPLKSRVETQIPIKLTIHHLPQGIKRVHLPTHTISKPKLLAKPAAVRSPDMLELHTMLVCTSAMHDPEKKERAFKRAAAARHDYNSRGRLEEGIEDEDSKPQNGGEVRICAGCITRERKRAGRKKHKKPEEEELWNKFENERVIVFNTQEVKDWQTVTPLMADPTGAGLHTLSVPDGTVQVDAPMRIACYCRHHGEKMGFQVIFTVKDYQDNVVAQQISSSIMITDDHKTHLPAPTSQSSNSPTNVTSTQSNIVTDTKPNDAPLPFRQTHSTSDLQGLGQKGGSFAFPAPNSQTTPVTATRSLSRQTSPITPSGPVSKKRKASSSSKVPSGLAMTRLETSQPPSSLPPSVPPESTAASSANSPFSPSLTNFPLATDSLYLHTPQQALSNMSQPFATGPPTPNSNSAEQLIFPSANRSMNLENIHTNHMFSAPPSAHPSRAPSPNQIRNELQNMQHSQLGQAIYNTPMGMTANRIPTPPMIYKIIPGEGPKSGGVEVTILGSGFTNGGLEVMFGEQRAATTTFWGETSLVCLLPPSPTAGVVPVSIKHPGLAAQHAFSSNQQPQPLFRYVDDDEHRLIRTALTVLGNKLGGKITDVADIARNIIYGPGSGGSWGPSTSGPGGQAPGNNFSLEHETKESLETGLLRVLELIDLDDSANKARINLRRSSGQTMLHLACSLGLIRFVAGLLSRGANVGIRDKGGFTPLHMAAMNDHPEIVRRLIMKGADPNMRSLSGLTPADVARSNDVLRVLRRIESHSRSRSGGAVHSRVNSANSLRSLWDHPSITQAHRDEFMSDGGDSSSRDGVDSSSEEIDSDDEDPNWLDMRRPSYPTTRHCSDAHQAPNVDAIPASPGAAMTAIREQVATQLQQFQHSMAMHFQNLPQFQMPNMPQMPTLPVMPVLPDYQAYLHSAPVMQRISSLVPTIRGQRPESTDAADSHAPRDTDHKWWDLFGAKESPPPAYEDIFPQKHLETKQASAAQAAAEAEADAKCATLYDETALGSSQIQQVPAMLQIGRKHNITREQQENLMRAHAQRLKTGSSDKMLWFVWIPILVLVLGAMMWSGAPSFISGTANVVKSVASFVANPRGLSDQMNQLVQEGI